MSLVKRIASLSVSTGIVFNNFPLTVFCKKIKFIQYTAKTTKYIVNLNVMVAGKKYGETF